MKVGQKVRPDTKCSRRLEDFLQLPSKASTNLGASQCLLPAITGKRVCRVHGGKSTGPRTQQGRNLCGAARTIHGRETRGIRAKRQQALAELKLLERMGKGVGVLR